MFYLPLCSSPRLTAIILQFLKCIWQTCVYNQQQRRGVFWSTSLCVVHHTPSCSTQTDADVMMKHIPRLLSPVRLGPFSPLHLGKSQTQLGLIFSAWFCVPASFALFAVSASSLGFNHVHYPALSAASVHLTQAVGCLVITGGFRERLFFEIYFGWFHLLKSSAHVWNPLIIFSETSSLWKKQRLLVKRPLAFRLGGRGDFRLYFCFAFLPWTLIEFQ